MSVVANAVPTVDVATENPAAAAAGMPAVDPPIDAGQSVGGSTAGGT